MTALVRSVENREAALACRWVNEMSETSDFDAAFREAVTAIDAGDVVRLQSLLTANPELAAQRLDPPGQWLRDEVGDALDGFFRAPYLMWFVAEDPVRRGRLPANIVEVLQTIVAAARHHAAPTLREQLEYTLRLVCWSWIARECGVQIGLIDALLDAGASLEGSTVYEGRYGSHADAAIYNRNFAAAERLVERGAPLTLTTALALGRWSEAERLAAGASDAQRQDAFVQAALNGQAEALRRMLAHGLDATTISSQNQSHGTALHHAVWSGSMEAVRVLIEAGADRSRRDTLYDGTPLDWARHGAQSTHDEARKQQYAEIAAYLAGLK